MNTLIGALRTGHWPSLLAAWLHFEISFMAWLLIGALGVLISDEFGLTASAKGLLVATPLLGGAFLRIVVGACSDRFGAKRTGLVLLAAECVALVWGWVGATTYLQILGVGLLLGAAGASFAVALPLASRSYPPAHQGLAMGLAAAGNSGVVLVAFFAPRLGLIVGWHGVFALMCIPVVITAVLFALLVRSDLGQGHIGGSWYRLTIEGLRQPAMYWLCYLYAITFGGFVGLSSFLPIFFHDEYGLSSVMAGTITAACGLAGSAIRPLGGFVADRRDGLLVLRFLFPLIAVLVLCVAQLPRFGWAAPLMIMVLAALGFGNGVVFQVVSGYFHHRIGVATGLVGASGGLGGFVLPTVLGRFKDLFGTYGAGFLVFLGLVLLAWVTVELMIRRKRVTVRHVTPFGGVSH